MNIEHFIAVGENIHCTRTVKSGGKKTIELDGGGEAVAFEYKGEKKALRVPEDWGEFSPAYGSGKIKHAALAVHTALNTDNDEDRQTAEDYLAYLADVQITGGAKYLDINADEYTSDAGKNAEIMGYLAAFYSRRYDVPLSIDSSNPAILRAGLEKCRQDIAPPMINSVSLERLDVVDMITEFNADVIVSAAGREDLPNAIEGRRTNFREIIGILDAAGVDREKMHLDPLCFPISTNPENGTSFLDAVSAIGEDYPRVHFSGGLSNISFGMPNRKLLNLAFAVMYIDAGGDGGLIDTAATPLQMIAGLDTGSDSFRMAQAVLTGEDQFGMAYITAFREGTLTI